GQLAALDLGREHVVVTGLAVPPPRVELRLPAERVEHEQLELRHDAVLLTVQHVGPRRAQQRLPREAVLGLLLHVAAEQDDGAVEALRDRAVGRVGALVEEQELGLEAPALERAVAEVPDDLLDGHRRAEAGEEALEVALLAALLLPEHLVAGAAL